MMQCGSGRKVLTANKIGNGSLH